MLGYGFHPLLCLVGFQPPKGEIDMKKLMTMTRQFRDDENGAAMVEYSILVGLITAAVITLIIGVGAYVTNAWQTLCTNLGTVCTTAAAAA
jgi:pilus assembly protein Flp/PilA